MQTRKKAQTKSKINFIFDVLKVIMTIGGVIVIITLVALFFHLPVVNARRINEKNSNAVCDDFELVSGDMTTPNQVILGDYHSKSGGPNSKTIACVERVTANKPSHTILLEAVPAGKIVECEDFDIPNKKGRTCKGWDLPPSKHGLFASFAEDAQNKIHYQNALHHIQGIYKQFMLLPDKSTGTEFNELLREIQNTLKEQLADIDSDNTECETELCKASLDPEGEMKQSIKVIDDFFAKRNKKIPYSSIFRELEQEADVEGALSKYNSERISKNNMQVAQSIKKRNDSLLSELLKHQGIFTVAIAGRAHVVNLGGEVGKPALYLQEELQKGRHQNPYAILSVVQS